MFGKKQSDWARLNCRINQPNLKSVLQMDLEGNVIGLWSGVRLMCRELNLDMAAVKRVILGKNKHHKGFTFKFV